jgi:hypothetical protein
LLWDITKISEKQYGNKERIFAYIDGFNLYFGLKSKSWKRYYWLDLQKTVQNLLKPNQVLDYTKYFTARITGPPLLSLRAHVVCAAIRRSRREGAARGNLIPLSFPPR